MVLDEDGGMMDGMGGAGDDLWLRVTLIQANMETASVFCANDLCASVLCFVFFECDVIYE